MEINEFIQNFAEQFDETDSSAFTAETQFRDIDEWSSMIALSEMAMINEEYDIIIKADEMRNANTIQDLFDIVNAKA